MRSWILASLLALLALPALPAYADIDAAVRRQCLARCAEFKDRPCCRESCDYVACIAGSTKARLHGLDTEDPGAWSAAMATCYPFIQIIMQCGAEAPAKREPPPPPPPTRPAPEGRPKPRGGLALVLESVGSDPADLSALQGWSVDKEGGKATYRPPGGTMEYTWSLPREIDKAGQPASLSGRSTAKAGRWAFSIAFGGDVDFEPETPHLQKVAEVGETVSDSRTVTLRARTLYPGASANVVVSLGAFRLFYRYVAR